MTDATARDAQRSLRPARAAVLDARPLEGPIRCDDDVALRAAITAGFEAEGLSEQSCRRLLQVALRFVAFVDSNDASLLDADARLVREFLAAPLESGAEPSIATAHLRRSALRLLFNVLRHTGIVDHDPTLDVALPPRSSLASRPLTDDEIAVCRSFSLTTLTETRQPAAWALTEASARTSEIPRIHVRDLDLGAGRVWLPGGTKVDARSGLLTEWGVKQLARRLDAIVGCSSDTLIVYRAGGSAESAQASSCIAIRDTLRRAGFDSEPDVRPISIAAWAARRAFDASGHIEDAARVLGARSLDRAARLIGWDWTNRPEHD